MHRIFGTILASCEPIQCQLIYFFSVFFSTYPAILFLFSHGSINWLAILKFAHVCKEFTKDNLCSLDLFDKHAHTQKAPISISSAPFHIELINCLPLFILWLFKFYPNTELAVIYTRNATKMVLVFIGSSRKSFLLFFICVRLRLQCTHTRGECVAHLFSKMTQHTHTHIQLRIYRSFSLS